MTQTTLIASIRIAVAATLTASMLVGWVALFRSTEYQSRGARIVPTAYDAYISRQNELDGHFEFQRAAKRAKLAKILEQVQDEE